MPLHGKIVVIKRSGGDGTEFPLTASCLFGRKVDCDIRIQLPQVSKEHCRIDLNENKELILTNLSSVNPTRVNGEVLQQSERLKHGDVITIIDRSFRFEYPPAPTPKKRRSSTASKTETLQVLQDQQVRDAATGDAGDKRISEVSTDSYLKDGANSDNIQRPLEKTVEVETKGDGSLPQSQASSPFGELYQMIKQTLDAKTPRKSSLSQPQTPASRFYTPKPESAMKVGGKPVVSTEVKNTPMKVEAEVSCATIAAQGSAGVENKSLETPKSEKRQRRSSQVPSSEMTGLVAEEKKATEQAAKSAATPSPRRRLPATPQRFTVSEVVDQISAGTPKSPTRRRSKETTPVKPSVSKGEEEQPKVTEVQQNTPKTEICRTSPRSSQKKLKAQDVATTGNEKKEMVKKRKSGELGADLPAPQVKKKRVSFGGHLSPELFDKRLPPDSPLCKGATPRRSLSLSRPKQSLLRRTSVIGLIKEFEHEHASPAKTKTPSPKKSLKARSPSPKTPSPGKKSPKARTPSPKAPSSEKKSPKARTPSPKIPSSEKKSPKAKTPSPKTPSSEKKSPKARTPSPKTPSSEKKSPKAKTPSPKTPSSEKKSPKARTPSPKSSEVKSSPGRQSSASAKTPSPARGRSPSSGKSNTPKAEKSVTPVCSHTPTAVCVTPAKSPLSLEKQTPTTQGRFSVSRISTPSPITEQDVVADAAPSVPVTPKLPLRRKSMKSSSKKSTVEIMRRRSGVSRASLKAKNSWVDVVKFGQKKPQMAAPAKKTLTTKTRKVAVPKPETPARRLIDHVSTGHADSPVTIVVGKAHKRTVVQPTGAAPRLVHNTVLLKKNMKIDEDLTGIAEIFKTPVNARQRKSVINEQTVTKTPQGALGTAMIEASVLNTPEETGEMMVSPLSVTSAVKCRTYNSEAVHRLLQGEEESTFVSEVPALEISTDGSAEQQKTSVTTPKQKPVQPESLTGVKRIMKTPRQKAEPIEDLRGKLLKTPKQKPEQHECLTGVKRIMKTPRLKAEPVEDLKGKLLKTPKQKPEQHECLSGVKRIMKTPKQKAEPVEDLRGKLLKTPKTPKVADVDYDGIQELLETPKQQPVEDLVEVMAMKTPSVKSSPLVCATGIKRLMRTPKEKNAPVADMEGVKRLMKTPKAKSEPVEANFGIKRLMRSPRLKRNAPMEDFEGLKELMEEPCSAQTETNEEMETLNQDQTPLDCGVAIAEAEVPCEEQQECVQSENGPSEDVEDVPQADMVKEADVEEVPCAHEEPSDTMETVPEAAVDQSLPEEQPEVQTATCEVTEMDTASIAPDTQKKSTRGRRAKVVVASEPLEETTVLAPVRGRRVKKTESAPSPAVRQTARSRKAQSNEGKDAELTVEVSDPVDPKEKAAPKPKRGRNTKKVSVDQAGVVSEDAVEVVSDQIPPTNAIHEEHDSVTPLEEADLKPKRGRKAKPVSVKHAQKVSEKTEVVSDQPQPEEPSPIEAQSEEPIPVDALPIPSISVEKPRRGRKTKQDSIEQNEMVEAPVRAKRGKNAKREEEEEKVEVPVVETTESQEPIEKSKRTRKAKQNPVEPKEVDIVEDPVKEKVEAPPVASKARRTRMTKQDSAESIEIPVESASLTTLTESVELAEKPRRGRKAKQDPEHVTPVESTEVHDKPSAKPTEKPKRGRRAKQEVIEEAEIITEVTEEKAETKQEVEENRDDADSSSALADEQPDAPVIKPTRGRGVKSAVKNEVSQATPAKRARRGAAPSLQEAAATEAAVVSKSGSRGRAGKLSKADTADEPAEVSVEPARRGRKAATKPTIDARVVSSTEAMVEEKVVNAEPEVNKGKVSRRGKAASAARSDKANATEDVNNAVVENMTVSKKSVNWKDDLAVMHEITTPTATAKAARGRKTKLGDQDEASQGTPTKRSRRNPEPTVPCTSETATMPENKRKASRNAKKAEEEDLSGKAVLSEPVKRARRGGKAADTASVEAPTQGAEEVESTPKVPAKRRVNATKKAVAVDSVQAVEPETQPKPRRGRPAKK